MNFLLYGELYFAFFQVGALAFGGGLATLPLLEGLLVHDKAWIGVTEWSDVITISNMTPGPIAINAATFIGTKIGSGAEEVWRVGSSVPLLRHAGSSAPSSF